MNSLRSPCAQFTLDSLLPITAARGRPPPYITVDLPPQAELRYNRRRDPFHVAHRGGSIAPTGLRTDGESHKWRT